jgi:hypothetical protein
MSDATDAIDARRLLNLGELGRGCAHEDAHAAAKKFLPLKPIGVDDRIAALKQKALLWIHGVRFCN